ncbi:hypothetical protein ACFVFI_38150, partial [Streptomyces sp. NPDC057705]|uniref:hypothetical protein n=1 Tax=Streptomyces sp. NPDC057705 TaxID=3346222 RepID=UPI0036B9BA28
MPEVSVAEVKALTEELVARDVTAGARWAVGAALDAVRTVGRAAPVRGDARRGDAGRGDAGPDDAGRDARAELFQVAAWIAFDAERHDVSRRLHLRALELARGSRGAGPATVEPLILAVLAMQEEHLGRPGSSLRIASSVLAREDLPGRVAAIFQVRAGRALARLGRGPEAGRALRTAAELLTDPPTGRDPSWAWWFDRPELEGHHGLARAALGDLDTAAALLHGAAHAGGDGPAYRVLFAAELARVLARAGDRLEEDTAPAALTDTVPAVGSVQAPRTTGRAVP